MGSNKGNIIYLIRRSVVLSFVDVQSTLYLGALSALSFAALPYIVYSLYYQWRIVKQWCRLCLAVQAILMAQVVVVVYQGWYLQLGQISDFPVREVLSLILLYTTIVILGETLIRLGKKAKEGKKNKQSFIRLKSNPEIFEGLIRNQRQLSEVPNGLGIILGNPEAKHTLIKVCNPYCGPCAKCRLFLLLPMMRRIAKGHL